MKHVHHSRLSLPLVLAFALGAGCATPLRLPCGHDIGGDLRVAPTQRLSIVDASSDNFAHQTLLVEATVVRVCPTKGCWMQVEDEGHKVMVRWDSGCGGKFAFPKEAAGKRVLVQGSVVERQLTEAEIQRMEKDGGPGAAIPRVMREMRASAVRILDE